ncbi:RAN GTPase-activating protein [Trifolium repens]|nr:RAN GTPase-activating protein [Trifolium repens]KAK2389035.1 RAN GTPase-activating protein [Trifolium repens]
MAKEIEDAAFVTATQHFEKEPDGDGSSAVQIYAKYLMTTKLEHLSISSCKLVEEIFVHDEIMSHIAHVHDEIMSHIPHIRKSSHVEMVSTSCDQLLNVFPSHVLNKLQSIELWLQPPLEAMLKDFHRRRLQVLVEAGPDLLAFETIPNKLEAQAIVELLEEINVEIPSWICFTSVDGENAPSGESFRDCLEVINKCNKVEAFGINCAPPHFMENLISKFKQLTKKAIVVYTIF